MKHQEIEQRSSVPAEVRTVNRDDIDRAVVDAALSTMTISAKSSEPYRHLNRRRLLYMAEVSDQFAALQRIAVFSAAVRGHELGEWHAFPDFAQASCVR